MTTDLVTVSMPLELKERLKKRAEEEKLSMAELVRQLIEEYLS